MVKRVFENLRKVFVEVLFLVDLGCNYFGIVCIFRIDNVVYYYLVLIYDM